MPDKGVYTRRELLSQLSGRVKTATSAPLRDRLRRIWPDEPNVGFVEERMAFLVDGALKIGGPSLKTYDLNGDSALSWPRETRLYHDDTYGKLRGSENEAAVVDVFNCVGSWTSEDTIAAAAGMTWTAETVSDSVTYSWTASGKAVSIIRPGVYAIIYRAYGTPNAGSLRATLAAGSSSWEWKGTGLPTTLTVADAVVFVKTDTASSAVTLTLTAGTALGDTGALKSVLTILKMR